MKPIAIKANIVAINVPRAETTPEFSVTYLMILFSINFTIIRINQARFVALQNQEYAFPL